MVEIWGPALEAELEFRRAELMAGREPRQSRRARGAARIARSGNGAGTAAGGGGRGAGRAARPAAHDGMLARTQDAVRGACGWVLRRSGAWHVAR